MAHLGFAIFFLLSLIVAAIALVRTAVQNIERIRQALEAGWTTMEASSEVRIAVCETADVPRIARRLKTRFPDGLAPVLYVPRAAPFEPQQTAFAGALSGG